MTTFEVKSSYKNLISWQQSWESDAPLQNRERYSITDLLRPLLALPWLHITPQREDRLICQRSYLTGRINLRHRSEFELLSRNLSEWNNMAPYLVVFIIFRVPYVKKHQFNHYRDHYRVCRPVTAYLKKKLVPINKQG